MTLCNRYVLTSYTWTVTEIISCSTFLTGAAYCYISEVSKNDLAACVRHSAVKLNQQTLFRFGRRSVVPTGLSIFMVGCYMLLSLNARTFIAERYSVDDRLTILLFATNANTKFCHLLETAKMNDQNIDVIGWGAVDSRRFSRAFAEHLCSLNATDIVIGSDAFDALFTNSATPSLILEKFKKKQSDFIWSAESNMFPPFSELPTWVKVGYPQFTGKYMYLNFGAWIGRADAACHFFKRAANALDGQPLLIRGTSDKVSCGNLPHDQAAAHCVLAAENLNQGSSDFTYSLDNDNQIFHSAWPKCDDIDLSNPHMPMVTSTSTQPALLHFNGDSKRCSDECYRHRYRISREKFSEAEIRVFDTEKQASNVPLRQICRFDEI